MKDDLDSIIRRLEKAQDSIHKERYSEAVSEIYAAQSKAQYLKDQLNRK